MALPAIAAGGDGFDHYRVSRGTFAVVYDGFSNDTDTLTISDYASYITNLFSIENRHVFLDHCIWNWSSHSRWDEC